LRILLVSDLDPVEVIGGGERLLAGHAAGLTALGHEVFVCSGAPGPLGGPDGTPVLRIGRSPATPRRATRAVRGLRPDVVVGYQPATALWALWAAKRRGLPTIYVFSSPWAEEYATRRPRPGRAGHLLRLAWERACLRRADRVVVLSRYSMEAAHRAHPGVVTEVRLVAGGVDAKRFSPNVSRKAARARIGAPPGAPLLLTVRNLVPRMGLDNLLVAMPAVARAFPGVHLVVAGDGPLRSRLEARTCQLGLEDRVTFAGFVPEERLPDHYRAADLVVLPTRDLEGFGLTTVEALACGTPVLGTPVGATPEILGPLDPALLAEDATPHGLASGIVRVLRRVPPDLPERARRHLLARYTWDAAAAGLDAVVREVAP
jgi:glycosyltransferase involved in cell wall biosynthesis